MLFWQLQMPWSRLVPIIVLEKYCARRVRYDMYTPHQCISILCNLVKYTSAAMMCCNGDIQRLWERTPPSLHAHGLYFSSLFHVCSIAVREHGSYSCYIVSRTCRGIPTKKKKQKTRPVSTTCQRDLPTRGISQYSALGANRAPRATTKASRCASQTRFRRIMYTAGIPSPIPSPMP